MNRNVGRRQDLFALIETWNYNGVFFWSCGMLLTRTRCTILFKYGNSSFNENECPNDSMQGFKK
jgi:hypothetical protein